MRALYPVTGVFKRVEIVAGVGEDVLSETFL